MKVDYDSRIPSIISRLTKEAEDIEQRVAERIAQDASAGAPRASGDLAASYKADEGNVMAAWYYHFVENGTVKAAAQPHLMPAAERARAAIDGIGREEFKNL